MADACCSQERGANSDPSLEERSYYIDYIYRDLEPWKEKGITEVPFITSAFQAHGNHVCRLLHWGNADCMQLRGSLPRHGRTMHLGAMLACINGRGVSQGAACASVSGGARPWKPAVRLQQLAAGAIHVWVWILAVASANSLPV